MSNSIQAQVEQFDMPHPSGAGSFKISVSRLAGLAEGQTDVPVLFVLDADIAFALAAEIARLRGVNGGLTTAMVVGIGYGASFAEFAKLRTADLTPPLSEAGRQSLGELTNFIGDEDGGADAFLSFLTDALAPEVLRRYPEASPSEHVLYGHSLGGLFTAYALLTRPRAFSVFVSSSPSLWWDEFAVLSHLPAFSGKLGEREVRPRALICVGAKEQDIPTEVPNSLNMSLEAMQALVAASRMVDAAAEFAASLREAGLNEVNYTAFEGEDHGTVIPASITRALAFATHATRRPPLVSRREQSGANHALQG